MNSRQNSQHCRPRFTRPQGRARTDPCTRSSTCRRITLNGGSRGLLGALPLATSPEPTGSVGGQWSRAERAGNHSQGSSQGPRSVATRAPGNPKRGRQNNLQNSLKKQRGVPGRTVSGTPNGTVNGTPPTIIETAVRKPLASPSRGGAIRSHHRKRYVRSAGAE